MGTGGQVGALVYLICEEIDPVSPSLMWTIRKTIGCAIMGFADSGGG